MYVWCDYFSIPQANRHNQKAAIDSIPQYASNATFFLACAPDTCAAPPHTPTLRQNTSSCGLAGACECVHTQPQHACSGIVVR